MNKDRKVNVVSLRPGTRPSVQAPTEEIIKEQREIRRLAARRREMR